MERTIIFSLAVFLLLVLPCYSAVEQTLVQPVSVTGATQTLTVQKETTEPQNVSPTVPQVISFQQCTKKYMRNVEDLFFLSLASINANKFEIRELQSKNGYILFSVANREYLASVSKVDNNSAIVKITPADNNYYFPLGVLTNFYKYIDLNANADILDMEKIPE